MSRLKLFLPLFAFLALGVLLWRGLALDPAALPSALVGRPLPEFELPKLGEPTSVARADVVGETALLNVWATWCYSCRVEHPFLLQLADRGIPILGLNYKDESDPAQKWLAQLGDPYRLVIEDREGRLGLDLGVYGAPETYVIGADGTVQYRHVGVLDEAVWANRLAPFFNGGEP